MMSEEARTLLDVNAAAGELREIFTVDLTTATSQCNSCGHVAPLAESRVYAMAPGLVVRCATCEGVLMRVVTSPGRAWIDLRGLEFLQLAMPQSAP